MPPDLHRLDALIAGVSFKKFGPILRKVGKTSGTQGGYHQDFSSVLSYHDFRGGFLRATSRIYVAHGRRGQIVATAARTPRSAEQQQMEDGQTKLWTSDTVHDKLYR